MKQTPKIRSEQEMLRERDISEEALMRADSLTGRISTLHDIVLQIDAASTHDDVLNVLRREMRWLLHHDVALSCIVDKSSAEYVLTMLSGEREDLVFDRGRFPLEEGTPGVVIAHATPLLIELNSPDTDSAGKIGEIELRLRDAGMNSYLVVPLRSGDGTLGALAFATVRVGAYREQDVVIAQLLATQIAVALETTIRIEEAQRRIAQIELVNELAEDLTSTLDLDELLAGAAEIIRKAFAYLDVTIFLVDRQKSEAFLVAHTGEHPDFLPKNYRQNISDGIVGWAIINNQRVLVNDVSADPRYIRHTYEETRSELAIPIRVEHDIVGVLNVEDSRPQAFDDTDAIVLETLCDQIGSAIKNAQLYERLKRSNAKLTELDRMKTDFLGIVSHDFRSPLASIVLAAKSLQKRPDLLDQQRLTEYLQVIVDAATKLINLAEDTLSVTKLESGQLTYFFNMVNLERLVKDAAAMVNMSKRHTLMYEIDPNVAFVRGDQSKLRQVIQNLLSNAVKYSPTGGTIMLRALNHSTDHMVVAVRDEGIGIPEEFQQKLFQKFSRIESAETKEIKGSGLGLWICKEIVRAHGGNIWVESTPGKGSTFAFTLKKANSGVVVSPEKPA
jgi:K+-sensing histidine kinase KdpD